MRTNLIIAFLIALLFNIISLQEGYTMDKNENSAKAYFAGGCFWGVEYLFEHKEGVESAISGYMGGSLDHPTYYDVSHKKTGHIETVKVVYDPTIVSYEELTKFFFEIHDPTQENRQGPDIGDQYASAVFYENENEKSTVDKLIGILTTKGYAIATKVIPVTTFWDAEDYHQNYYDKKKSQPYCHAYEKKF
jgi:peptide methionine sulfoxide reductase msrA/msrB